MSPGPDFLPDAGDVTGGLAEKTVNEALNKIEKQMPATYNFIMCVLLLIPTMYLVHLTSRTDGSGWGVLALLCAVASIYHLSRGLALAAKQRSKNSLKLLPSNISQLDAQRLLESLRTGRDLDIYERQLRLAAD